jgi:hypothetical protein
MTPFFCQDGRKGRRPSVRCAAGRFAVRDLRRAGDLALGRPAGGCRGEIDSNSLRAGEIQASELVVVLQASGFAVC